MGGGEKLSSLPLLSSGSHRPVLSAAGSTCFKWSGEVQQLS